MARDRRCGTPGGFPPPGGSEAAWPRAAAGPGLSTAGDSRPGLPLRLYRPATEPRPLVLYLHGGGFVLGDLESHDSICRRLALIADVAVLAVDYRRAPEHPGPAAWTMQCARSGGHRHDGTSSAARRRESGLLVTAPAARRAAGRGATARRRDGLGGAAAGVPERRHDPVQPSLRQEGHGWGLEADDVRWSVEQWIPDPARRASPGLSPVHAELAGCRLPCSLPPGTTRCAMRAARLPG